MDRDSYCVIHRKGCFQAASTSSSCRRHQNSEEDMDDEFDQEGQDLNLKKGTGKEERKIHIADYYQPTAIQKHKVVKGGKTPPQLQFLVRWQDGYTTNKHLGSVIHKHPTEIGLYFIKYKPSWEPYNNYAITHLIPQYKVEQKISDFGDPFDQEIKDLIPKDFDHDAIQTYKFQYEERANAPEDTNVEDPTGRKKKGRPKNSTEPTEKPVPIESSAECGCTRNCRQNFDFSTRKKIRGEFGELRELAQRASWLSNHLVDLSPIPFGSNALEIRSKRRRKFTASYHFRKSSSSKKIQVCQRFFMHVLSIGNTLINNLNNHNYVNSIGGAQLVAHVDGRGRHSPKHKASEDTVEVLRKHILSFPREQSHYSLNKKQTLNPELSVKAMHSLYEEQERVVVGGVC